MAKALDSLTLVRARDAYILQIEDEDGETLELTASADQLELIVEEIDRHLDPDLEDELDGEPDEIDPDEAEDDD